MDALHKAGFVYRDLRPENVLLDDQGFIKLTDFGISKYLPLNNDPIFSFCGSPEYLSPEIILGEGYTKVTDWWSFGVLLYELAYGFPPFYDENTSRMYDLICNAEVPFPIKNQPINSSTPNYIEFKNLIMRLLTKDPNQRLGSKEGIDELKLDPFFIKLNFELVNNKKVKSLINPVINNSNFYTNSNGIVQKMNNNNTSFKGLKTEEEVADILINFDESLSKEKLDSSMVTEDSSKLINENKDLFYGIFTSTI